jgi:hypothetical protein
MPRGDRDPESVDQMLTPPGEIAALALAVLLGFLVGWVMRGRGLPTRRRGGAKHAAPRRSPSAKSHRTDLLSGWVRVLRPNGNRREPAPAHDRRDAGPAPVAAPEVGPAEPARPVAAVAAEAAGPVEPDGGEPNAMDAGAAMDEPAAGGEAAEGEAAEGEAAEGEAAEGEAQAESGGSGVAEAARRDAADRGSADAAPAALSVPGAELPADGGNGRAGVEKGGEREGGMDGTGSAGAKPPGGRRAGDQVAEAGTASTNPAGNGGHRRV